MSPEAIFFILSLCAVQPSTDSPVCNAAGGVVFAGINGQKALDRANQLFIDPLPADLKRVGALGLFYYKQELRIGLYKGLSLSMKFVRTKNIDEDVASQFLGYRMEFP